MRCMCIGCARSCIPSLAKSPLTGPPRQVSRVIPRPGELIDAAERNFSSKADATSQNVSQVRLCLCVPSQGKMQPSARNNSIFRLRGARSVRLGTGRAQTLEPGWKGMLKCDGHREISGRLRLHSKNLAASAGMCAGLGRVRSSKRHLYHGTLGNEERAGKQNAPETDVLRAGVHFLVSQSE